MDNPTEFYEIKSENKELHVISVMLEALDRHLNMGNVGPNCEQNVINGQKAMVRCAKYVLDVVSGN